MIWRHTVIYTEDMCKYAKVSNAKEQIVGTETGLVYRLPKGNLNKLFYPASEESICPNMKFTTLEKVLWALEDMNHEISLPEDIIRRAQDSIWKMIK